MAQHFSYLWTLERLMT